MVTKNTVTETVTTPAHLPDVVPPPEAEPPHQVLQARRAPVGVGDGAQPPGAKQL